VQNNYSVARGNLSTVLSRRPKCRTWVKHGKNWPSQICDKCEEVEQNDGDEGFDVEKTELNSAVREFASSCA
jgi:hypothetical protein